MCRPAGLTATNDTDPGLTSWATFVSPCGLGLSSHWRVALKPDHVQVSQQGKAGTVLCFNHARCPRFALLLG